ncbi:MAG TPA: hypothetical protein VGK31_00760 [Thermoanaerobaculia bacterium]
MRCRPAILGLALSAMLVTRCFDIEQTIDLKKDMSGTAGVRIGVDFEPMVTIMAQMAHDMSGKKGPATSEEIEKAKADFRKQQSEKKGDDQEIASALQKKLPQGITLLDSAVTNRDFGVVSTFHFAFDRLSQLVGLELPSENSDPTKKSPISTPFASLEVVETADKVTIRTRPQNPADSVKQEASAKSPTNPEMEKMMRDAFKKMRIAYRITAPFRVLSANATRREGNTLIWEFDFDRMEKLAKAGSSTTAESGVSVTYHK